MSIKSLALQRHHNEPLAQCINQYWAQYGIDANARVVLKKVPIAHGFRKGVRVLLKKPRMVTSNEIVSDIKPNFEG